MSGDILIIKLSSLGDIFMALPHVDAILAHHDPAVVTLLTTRPFAGLFDHHPRLQIAILDRSTWLAPESTLGRMRWVRKTGFESIYDLQGNRVSRLIVRWSGAAKRVGKEGGSVYNCYPPDDDEERHVFTRLTRFLQAAGIPEVPPRCTLFPSTEDGDRVREWKRSAGVRDGRYVLMHAGSSPEWPTKQWPASHFAELATMLAEIGRTTVWIGAREDAALNRRLAATTGLDATGQFSIMQLYLLAKTAECALTNDSGPMHIVNAAGIPVYSFFGPTNWARHHAFGQGERVFYREVDCGPCYRKTCPPKYALRCLTGIPPEAVFDRMVADRNGSGVDQ